MATEKRLIDATAFYKELYERPIDFLDVGGDFGYFDETIESVLNEQPTVEAVEVSHGRWIEEYVYDPDPHDRLRYKCSVCGRTEEYREPYCNCGAKMDGDGNG